MVSIGDLFNDIMELIGLRFYTKTETNSLLGNKLEKTHTTYKGKNVVVDGTTGDITFEDKPTIPKIFYGTSSTSATTRIKDVTTSSDYTLTEGTILIVKFTNGQTYNAKSTSPVQLSVNNNNGVDVASVGTTKTTRYYWKSGEVVCFAYDGTNFIMLENGIASTTYYGVTKLSDSVTSTSTELASTANAVKTAYDLADGKADAIHNHVSSDITDLSIPSASTSTPSVDVSGGSVGSGTTWARADHQHPLSNAYATGNHAHGNIMNTGAIGSDSGKVIVTTENGVLSGSDWYDEVSNITQALIDYGETL